jgi:hypothetical protein
LRIAVGLTSSEQGFIVIDGGKREF